MLIERENIMTKFIITVRKTTEIVYEMEQNGVNNVSECIDCYNECGPTT